MLYCSVAYIGVLGIMEKKMEATILAYIGFLWGYIGFYRVLWDMENGNYNSILGYIQGF